MKLTFLSPPKLLNLGSCGVWCPQRTVHRRMTCMTTPIHYEFCVQISESVLRRRYNERQKKSCSYNYTYNYRRGSEFTLSMWSNKLVIVTHTNALEMYLDCDIPHSRVSFRIYMVASGTKRWIVCVCVLLTRFLCYIPKYMDGCSRMDTNVIGTKRTDMY